MPVRGVASVATTYITGTLTGLISEAVGGRRWARAAGERRVQQRLLLPAAVWATYLAAALAGAAATRAWSTQAIWIPVAAVSAVTGITFRSAR